MLVPNDVPTPRPRATTASYADEWKPRHDLRLREEKADQRRADAIVEAAEVLGLERQHAST